MRRVPRILVSLIALLGGVGWAMGFLQASDRAIPDLVGPAFSLPDQEIEMPEGWRQQPIRYDHWATRERADLAISLDQQIYQMFLPEVVGYAARNNIRIAVQEGTCGISSGGIIRKQVDLAVFCCAPGATDRLPGLRFHTMGIAAKAFFDHPSNPVTDIALVDLRKIYEGDYFYWADLPESYQVRRKLPVWPIQVVGRLHCKLRPGHWRLLLNHPDQYSARMNEVGAIQDMITQVMALPGAIGYETLYHVEKYGKPDTPRILTIDGYDPRNVDEVATLRYPLYRVFNITTWDGAVNPNVAKFLEFIQELIEKQGERFGLVPVSRLRQAGWRFVGDEVVGEPGNRSTK